MADNEKLGSTSPQILLKNATNLDKLVNGRESESWPDRFAVLRRTWYGMEMAFNRFITYITGRGEQAVGAIGWQELGNWATGLTVDNRQQIVYYNGSWYKYLGELEHVITGDSPENDGGVWSAENPTGKWSNIGDAALRSNLGSGEGTEYIGSGLTTLDKILRVNIRQFGAHSRTEAGYETFDSRAATQSAIEYVRGQGGGEVFFPEGDWYCSSLTEPAVLPGDDGTVAPAFIATGNDQNIDPESVTTMYAALRSYHKVTLVGAGEGVTTISGDWDINTGAINPAAGIGIYFGAASKSKNITYGLRGITLKNFFIGRYVDGISENSHEDDLYILNCGISGIVQGQERCISGKIIIAGCYSGDVIGGHWTQRNNSQNAANIPPYPATDVQLLGWADASPVDNYIASQHSVAWGERHVSIDNFFDTYFFKSANSRTTANGGRLSNTSDNIGVIPQWHGIAGRARTVLSRYGRQINNMDIFNLKLLRQHRTPIYVSTSAGRNPVHQAYIEGIGLVNPNLPAGTGNYFGIDVADPLRPERSGIGYLLGEGGAQLDFFTTASNNQHAPLISSNKVKSAPETALTYLSSMADSGEVDRATVWDGTNTDIRYLRNFSSAFSQPIAFSLGGPTFRYAVGYFTPKLLVGGNQLSLSVARGYYVRNGNTITASVQFQSAGSVTLAAGEIVISGLPFVIPDGVISVHHGQVTLFSLAAAGVVALPLFNEATTTITLTKDTRGTRLNGSETSAGVLYLNLSFTMSIVG